MLSSALGLVFFPFDAEFGASSATTFFGSGNSARVSSDLSSWGG